jgi:hypothetical protein
MAIPRELGFWLVKSAELQSPQAVEFGVELVFAILRRI